jgi:hypothetical protein
LLLPPRCATPAELLPLVPLPLLLQNMQLLPPHHTHCVIEQSYRCLLAYFACRVLAILNAKTLIITLILV